MGWTAMRTDLFYGNTVVGGSGIVQGIEDVWGKKTQAP
jgi:hypothetical protein